MTVRRSALGLACFALGLAACAPSRAGPATPIRPAPTALPANPTPGAVGILQPALCSFPLPEDLREGEDVECFFLPVPERRSPGAGGTAGRVIQLAVAVLHPPGGPTHSDPVVYLSGGPGASALEMLQYSWEAMTEPIFAIGRDLVVFDQRGVGRSRPALDCPEVDRLAVDLVDRTIEGEVLSKVDAERLLMDRLMTCRDRLAANADLSAYNSATSADDVEDLRRALGVEAINLWGGSYGTRLALEVMRRHPDGLRSVVLDAVYPPEVDLFVEAPSNFERALEALFASCAANPTCGSAFPALRSEFLAMVARLNDSPILRTIEDPFTQEDRPVWTDGDVILSLTFQLLYDSRLRYLLPQQIDAATQGDYRAFDLARVSRVRLIDLGSQGMSLSVQCHEEVPFSSLEALQRELAHHPGVRSMYEGSLLGNLVYEVCLEWGAGQADPAANEAVSSDLPTLVLAGEFDPITPPFWGRRAARNLSRAYFYEFPGLGHGAVGVASCPSAMFTAFLEDPDRPPDDSCIADMR